MSLRLLLRPGLALSLAVHGVVVAAGWLAVAPVLAGPTPERLVGATFASEPLAEPAAPPPPDVATPLPDPSPPRPEPPVDVLPPPDLDDMPAAAPSPGTTAPDSLRPPVGLRVAKTGAPPIGLGSSGASGPAGPAGPPTDVASVVPGGATEASRSLPSNRPPAYPAAAQASGAAGTVWLLVVVAEDGAVSSVSVDRTSGWPLLDAAALAAVRSWRYEPALRGGAPATDRFLLPIRFLLRDP